MKITQTQLEQVNDRMQALIRSNSFYGKKLEAAGMTEVHTPEEFAKLPFSEKKDLRDAYPLGLMAVPEEEIVRIHSSSGYYGHTSHYPVYRQGRRRLGNPVQALL